MYKDIIPVSVLGLVDDCIGVTEAGDAATEMNVFLNAKTAEEGLQYSAPKCKTMLIGKKSDKPKNVMYVDKWQLNFFEDKQTGQTHFKEAYEGQVPISNTDIHKYLGHMISSTGDNSVNIKECKKLALGNMKKIFSKLKSLNLMKYYLSVL